MAEVVDIIFFLRRLRKYSFALHVEYFHANGLIKGIKKKKKLGIQRVTVAREKETKRTRGGALT